MAEPTSTEVPSDPIQKLVEQYELPDAGFDPELDAAPTPVKAATPEAPPRDPETGRFVKHTHSKALAKLAQEFGLSDDEIADTPGEDLRTLVAVRSQTRTTTSLPPAAGEPAPSQPPPAATPAEAFALKADLEQYDTDLANDLRAIAAELNRLRAVEARVQRAEQFQHAQAQDTMATRADRVFAKHAAMLGSGTRDDLDKDSPEYQRRIAVLTAVARDQGPGSFEAKIDKHAKLLFGTVPETTAVANGRITKEQWESAGVGRPTHRQQELPKGDKRAAHAVAQKLKDRGIGLDDDVGTEEKGLPD